jgi:glycosyltransferase involved in cell wall biosynthesis
VECVAWHRGQQLHESEDQALGWATSVSYRSPAFDESSDAVPQSRPSTMLMPSWGLPGSGARRVRLIALLAVRNGIPHLPGFLRNVAPQVDAIVALDDGSTDGTAELLGAHPSVVELLRVPPERPAWDEVGNHRALVAGALRQQADWILCVDADERLERDFRARTERVIARGALFGHSAYAVRLRELWDEPGQYRADGVWGRKMMARLFRARADHEFDPSPLHGSKAPMQARRRGRFPSADLTIYHLGMLSADDRAARRQRYESADPERRWQAIGYEYLTDLEGLTLRRIPARRAFTD